MSKDVNKGGVVLRDLTIGYQTKQGNRIVASGMSAVVRQGELTCLIGPNGVGKSTLLRTLSAFQPPLSGSIEIDGRDITTFSARRLSRTVGVVLTEKPDIHNMTVHELVSMGRTPYTGFWGTLSHEDVAIVDESIRLVGIEKISLRLVDTLSDGERQKVMVAKSLAQQTPVIFLDEPTAFLDFPSKVELMQLLRRLAHEQQKTVFMSTHDLELALQVADTVWLMECTRFSVGTPRQLAADGTLSRFVERDDIHFDRQTLSVRIDEEV